MYMFRVFQIAVSGGWENLPPWGLESEILLGNFFNGSREPEEE